MTCHRLIVALLLVGAWMLAPAPALSAAESPDQETIRRQAAEVERLQQELREAQEKLQRLQAEGKTPAPAASGGTGVNPELEAAPQPGPAPDPAREVQPDVQPTSVISAEDLVRRFLDAPDQAARLYTGKTFLVRGTVAGFSHPRFVRRYVLELASPEPRLSLACRFNYVDLYRTVYLDDEGTTILGRAEGGADRTLCRRGEELVIRGRCRGLKSGRIEFTDCERVPVP